MGGTRQARTGIQAAVAQVDLELAREELAEVVVQVNGKLRGRIHVPFGTAKEELERIARQDEKVQPFLEGKQPVKTIIVADKLVNLVVK